MTTSTTQPDTKAPETGENAPVAAEEQVADPKVPATKQDAVKRAYAEATTALRETHRDEFNADVKQRVKGYGFDWDPKPTAEEKAKAEIARLIKEAGLTPADLAALSGR